MRQKTPLTEIKTIDTRSEQEKQIQAIRDSIQVTVEAAKATSQVAMAQFKGLTEQGFTEQQAMEIILAHPIWK